MEQTFTEPFAIGRAASCEVQFEVKSVSRLHARVVVEGGRWWVQDAGSVNGLYVEGRKMTQVEVSRPTALRLGPSGPVVHFSIAYPEAPAPWPEAPRQEPAARARIEPAAPAKASFRPPPQAPPRPQPPAKLPPVPAPPAEAAPPKPSAAKAPPRPEPAAKAEPEKDAPEFPKPYRADRFTFALGEDWTDETVYTLGGPVTDGVQHNITIHIEPGVQAAGLLDYAEEQVQGLNDELTGFRLLKEDQVELSSGLAAYRAIFVWYPAQDQRLYQEQLYVLHQQTGYTLTATFTKKTRKTLGPQVERIMLSFTPTP